MLRTLGVQTLTGAAQPVMGDVTTAAVAIPPDGQDAIITVANTAIYQADVDRIAIDPFTASADSYRVSRIISPTVMWGTPEGGQPLHAHANGAIIALADAAIDVVVKPVPGGAANIVIGSDNTVTATPGGNVVTVIEKTAAGTETVPWHMAGGVDHNIVNTSEAWMIGTAGDKVLVYALVL